MISCLQLLKCNCVEIIIKLIEFYKARNKWLYTLITMIDKYKNNWMYTSMSMIDQNILF